ncbi:MAG: hypothetical protein AB7P31_00475 [Steroidobacteraceae bacterium]
MQDRSKVVLVLIGPLTSVPDVGRLPDQPPDAVHDVASVAVHVSVDRLPAVSDPGCAWMLTTGGKAATTETVSDACADATGFVQVSV